MMTNKEDNPARHAIAIVDGETTICDNDEHVQIKTHTTHMCMLCAQSNSDLHEASSPESSERHLENSEDSSVWKSCDFCFSFYVI